MEEHRPVFPFLDDDRSAAVLAEMLARHDDVRLARQLRRFRIVHDQEVGATHDFAELFPLRLDPDVDRVDEDELGRGELVEHGQLQVGADVAEHHVRHRLLKFREARLEALEDVELEVLGVAAVVIFVVAAAPSEGPTGLVELESRKVDAALGEFLAVAVAEVVADDAHDVGRREVTGGEAGVRRAAAEDTFAGGVRGDDAVVGDGTDDEDVVGRGEAFDFDAARLGHVKSAGLASRRRKSASRARL